MIIERTKEAITIKISSKIKTETIQNFVDYLEYLEVISNSKAKQEDIDELAKEINNKWWKENRSKFIK